MKTAFFQKLKSDLVHANWVRCFFATMMITTTSFAFSDDEALTNFSTTSNAFAIELQSLNSDELKSILFRSELDKRMHQVFGHLLNSLRVDDWTYYRHYRVLESALKQHTPKIAHFILEKLNRSLLPIYILRVTENWSSLPQETFAPELRERLEHDIDNASIRFMLIPKIFESADGHHSHGAYFYQRKEFGLVMQDPDSIQGVLAHELTHAYLDDHLKLSRSEDRESLDFIYSRNRGKIAEWSEHESRYLGWRIFRSQYQSHYKEAPAFAVACRLTVAQLRTRAWQKLPEKDIARYIDAILGRKSCGKLAWEWIQRHTPASPYATVKGSESDRAYQAAIQTWRDTWDLW